MSGRTALNRDEINFLVDRMVAGRTWAQAKDDFNALYLGIDATALDTYETDITALSVAKAAEAAAEFDVGPDGELAYLATITPPTVTSATAQTTSGKADTVSDTVVDIVGEGFFPGATVTFDGVDATEVEVLSLKHIRCVAPAHAAGDVDVIVTNESTLADTLAAGLTHEAVVPTCTSAIAETVNSDISDISNFGKHVFLPTGPAAGGTHVVVTGTNFFPEATVTFGGQAATSVLVGDSKHLTCKTPAHAAGAVDVVVTNPNTQAGTGTGLFTYV